MASETITQADREAAVGAYFSCYEDAPNDLWLDALRAGKHDDDPQVQAFAAHRRAAVAELVEAIEPLIAACEADFMDEVTEREAPDCDSVQGFHGMSSETTFGHIRRARKVISRHQAGLGKGDDRG